ncbi:MAG: NAD(P) transhydrogenase subunit alpha [Bacteroidota bacterium]
MNGLTQLLHKSASILAHSRTLIAGAAICCWVASAGAQSTVPSGDHPAAEAQTDYWTLFFVLVLATFIGVGVIARVSRLLHTPLMSITNAISAIAVVGSIIVTGSDYPTDIRLLGAIALFASMTNIVSGFLITDRMLKMFKPPRREAGGQERTDGSTDPSVRRKEMKP